MLGWFADILLSHLSRLGSQLSTSVLWDSQLHCSQLCYVSRIPPLKVGAIVSRSSFPLLNFFNPFGLTKGGTRKFDNQVVGLVEYCEDISGSVSGFVAARSRVRQIDCALA
jgi:hypothetical protein